MPSPTPNSIPNSTPPIAAFFDMDHTVIACNSANRYARYLYKRKELPLTDVLRTFGWFLQYKFASLDAVDVIRRVISNSKGDPEIALKELCQKWFEDEIQALIYPDARRAIEHHQAQGHHVVLLTASTNYIAQPVADHLHLDACLSTRLEVANNHFTGLPIEPICYGAGKIVIAKTWSESQNLQLSDAYFYTDSITDLPMLKQVAHPIAINPDPRLRRHAKKAGYKIERWR